MAATSEHVEQLLGLIAAAGPAPWFPYAYAEKHKVDRASLDALLEELWLRKLIERAPGESGQGAGVVLTNRGKEVLDKPEMRERLRSGEPLDDADRGIALRQALRQPVGMKMTWLLMGANLLVFAWGAIKAEQKHALSQYLKGQDIFGRGGPLDARVITVLHEIGALRAEDLAGREWQQWWRVLGSALVHVGGLDILLSLIVLYSIGRWAESIWGRWRFLALYLLCAWSGSCIGLARGVTFAVGATAAVCGLMGADCVWALLNARHLPRDWRSRAKASLMGNVLWLALILFMSAGMRSVPVGGLIAGVAAGVFLNVQRFGARPLRVPALVAAAMVPVVAFVYLREAQVKGPKWQLMADEEFEKGALRNARRELREATKFFEDQPQEQLERHVLRRNQEAVQSALPELRSWRDKLSEVEQDLNAAGVRNDKATEEARLAARDYARAFAELCGSTEQLLAAGERTTRKDEARVDEQARQVKSLRRKFEALFAP